MIEKFKFLAIPFFFVSLFLIVHPSNAQRKEVLRENQQWVQYYGQLQFKEEWVWFFDGGFRWSDAFQEKSQYIVRSGIGYQLGKDMRISAGVATLGMYRADRLDRIEIRPYQDFNLNQSFGNIKSQHRFRLEERFFKKVEEGEVRNGHTFNFRFRYSLMFNVPVAKLQALGPEARLLLSVGDEIFINAGKEIVYNVFDQNRILIGPTLQLNNRLSLNCLYQSQFRSTSSPGKYGQLDILWVSIRQNFQAQPK